MVLLKLIISEITTFVKLAEVIFKYVAKYGENTNSEKFMIRQRNK